MISKLNFFRSSHFLSNESYKLFSEYHFKDAAFPSPLLSRFLSYYDSIVATSFSLTFANSIFLYSQLDSVLASKLISCPITLPILYVPPLTLTLSMSELKQNE